MKLFARGITLLILAIFLLDTTAPAQADISPPPYPDGANIYPNGEATQVRMVSETVDLYIIDEQSEDFPEGYAQVKAIFHMRNLGAEPETMDVYFPLHVWNCRENAGHMNLFKFNRQQPIRDFHAVVDGIERPTNTIYQRVAGSMDTDPLETDIACWVYFPTLFPVGREATIEVAYKVPPSYSFSSIGYGYVLHTGAGWKDTIGSADITVHMPYPITPENMNGYSPDSGISQGSEITWHFEDFEPDRKWDIDVGILKPKIWKAIQNELRNTQANPQDGEAWGRLGLAYKHAFFYSKGFRQDAVGEQIYQASVDAYTHAVTLKPDDIDWQAGFADLLCDRAHWAIEESRRTLYIPCIEQLNTVLEMDSDHAIAQKILEGLWYSEYLEGTGYVVLDASQGEKKHYLLAQESSTISRPPTITAHSTNTFTPRTTRTLTPTPQPTQTLTPAPVAVITFLTTPTPAEPTKEPAAPNNCGSITLPLILVAVFLFWRIKG